MNKPIIQALLDLCLSVTAKRPKTVIDHILQHGFITTEELKEQYGYNHPPRAVRDVRENGIPIDKQVCISCYWAYPEDYTHIAMRQIRRVDLLWEGEEIAVYEKLKAQAINLDQEIPSFVKRIIEQVLERHKP